MSGLAGVIGLSLGDAKEYLQLDGVDHDARLQGMFAASIAEADAFINRAWQDGDEVDPAIPDWVLRRTAWRFENPTGIRQQSAQGESQTFDSSAEEAEESDAYATIRRCRIFPGF